MEGAPLVFSVVGALFGMIATALMGMAVNKLNEINAHLEKLNGKVFEHITKNGIHETAVAKIDEQIKSLLQTVTVAHQRIDRMKQDATG